MCHERSEEYLMVIGELTSFYTRKQLASILIWEWLHNYIELLIIDFFGHFIIFTDKFAVFLKKIANHTD